MKNSEQVCSFTDHQNQAIVLITLNSKDGPVGEAILDLQDYQELQEVGLTGSWFLNNGKYVAVAETKHRGDNEHVARLITKAPNGIRVRYRDGDTLNLCRANLSLDGGSAPSETPINQTYEHAEQ